MKVEWVDAIIERAIRKRPGLTRSKIAIIVAVYFPAGSRYNIKFILHRDRLIKICLQSGKYDNRGRPNKHAWFLRNSENFI